MTRFARFALASALLLAPLAAHAQSPLVGKWEIEFTAGMRIENEDMVPIKAKGTLTITEQGDSLIALLDVIANDQVPARPQARLAGAKATGATASLIQRSRVTINSNGEEQTSTAVSTWTLTANGSELTGTVQRAIEGMPMGMPAAPVTGKRM